MQIQGTNFSAYLQTFHPEAQEGKFSSITAYIIKGPNNGCEPSDPASSGIQIMAIAYATPPKPV